MADQQDSTTKVKFKALISVQISAPFDGTFEVDNEGVVKSLILVPAAEPRIQTACVYNGPPHNDYAAIEKIAAYRAASLSSETLRETAIPEGAEEVYRPALDTSKAN